MAGKLNKEIIENKIKELELKTECEIVASILQRSDDYPAAHYRFAILFSLITCLMTSLYFDQRYTVIILLISGFFLYLVSLNFGPFSFFINKSEKENESMQMAYQIFLENKIDLTKERTGVLVLYSILERKIIILCDSNVKSKISNLDWADLVKKNTDLLKNNDINTSLLSLLEDIGLKLTEFFPLVSDDKDRLPNSLITDLN